MPITPTPWWLFFWIGLFGIIASGLMVDLGGDYWAALATVSGLTPHRNALVLVVFAGFVILCDLCALGVIFAGGVLLVQRLRGRY